MSRFFFTLLCFLQLPVFSFAASRATVDELNKLIVSSQKDSDSKIAGRLAVLELTERLSDSKLAAMEAALPGPESRQALVMLADQAAFLMPPAAEIPQKPAPSFANQRAMIAKAIEYVRRMEERLPNLFALRDTIHFEDNPPGLKLGSADSFNPAQPLHAVSRTGNTVLYRDGQDFLQIAGKEQPATTLTTKGLSSFGEFGPILAVVLIDLPQGKLAWSHWEQGAAKPVAVFGFSVPRSASHYAVRFCCVGSQAFQQNSGYHGEMTIDPTDGTVLRLTLMADLADDGPITRADMMVEYGPVELGGKAVFCPKKSISISLSADQAAFRGSNSVSNSYAAFVTKPEDLAKVPKQMMLNEVVFDHYHLFGSESHILTAANSTSPPAPDSGDTAEVAVPATTAPTPAPTAAENTASAAGPAARSAPGSDIASAASPSGAAAPPVVAAPATPAKPEIRVTPQQTPVVPDVAPDEAKFSLRVTTRIVDVSVAAFDKKGQPITDLKPQDFDIYDSGKKQTLRSFGRAVDASAPTPVSAAVAQPADYTNRPDAGGSATDAVARAEPENSTIIFFDATSLQFDDLTRARQQTLQIINTLPASEPVGLYVRIGFGFRVLLEATTDRAALTSALNQWKPDARDVARAREAEARNRQQFDALLSPKAVMATYALVGGFGGGPMTNSDPRLFNQGEEPTREALSVLLAVATHMGAIAGHKNLVWVASDNVLADWSDQSASGDEGRMGPNRIAEYSIPTQEALNNAHVSLYPFDASQLETDATDASLQNAGVGLDPSSESLYPNFKPPPGGRTFTQLRTQTHTVQVAIQQLAQSTGGQAFGRSGNVLANLNRVIADSKAIYLLSFCPDAQPDDKYHQIKVTLPGRRDVSLRYRTGYFYGKEPTTLKARFAQVLWQPFDSSEIALTARRSPTTGGAAVSLNIAANDVGLTQQGGRWTGKLDVFLVQRDDTGAGALIKEQTLALDLSATTHDRFLRDGIPFDQYLDSKQNASNVRLIVVDEASGHIGSITLPPATQSVGQ